MSVAERMCSASDIPAASSGDVRGAPPERLLIDIVEDAGDWSAVGRPEPLIEPLIAPLAALIAQRPGLGGGSFEATVALSDDACLRRLNRTYRGKDQPTNVLSFPAAPGSAPPGPDSAPEPLGDVVLAAETVLREAAALGIAPNQHFLHLVLHGILHLAGFDHEADEDAREMEAIETTILAGLGVPDPHAALTDR